MGQIVMTVRAIDWSQGNVGHVHVMLDGGSCRIDWGDGHEARLKTGMSIRANARLQEPVMI